MNITFKNLLVVAFTALGLTMPLPSSAAIVTATVDAQITPSITVSLGATSMVFGNMTAGQFGGTVVMNTDGLRVATGSVELNSSSVSSPATFSVSGTPNSGYSVVLPTSVTLSDGGANSMIVTNLRSIPDTSGQLSSNGVQSVTIGGTLNIGANQGFGNYSGSMAVVISYF